jgi:hypothetical protein
MTGLPVNILPDVANVGIAMFNEYFNFMALSESAGTGVQSSGKASYRSKRLWTGCFLTGEKSITKKIQTHLNYFKVDIGRRPNRSTLTRFEL